MNRKIHDVLIIGGGVSGAAQMYAFTHFTDAQSVVLLEKEKAAGLVNSKPTNNSQTLHEGDIETNYNREKAQAVQHKASFTRTYLASKETEGLYLTGPKMVLGVGDSEYEFISKRFNDIHDLYPTLQRLEGDALKQKEPNIFKGRSEGEKLIALYNPDGITVNYSLLAQSLLEDSERTISKEKKAHQIKYNESVVSIKRVEDIWLVTTNKSVYCARYVSVCAGAHSMYFAKKMDIKEVEHLSLLCVAGNFYYTPKYIESKIYTLQNPNLPFSAVHGDPDILNDEKTRFGPTTRLVFMLERHKYETVKDFLTTIPPLFGSINAYGRILLNKEFFLYALKHNIAFQLPFVGNYLFWREAQKIIPSLNYKDVSLAKGQGGVRPQIVNTTLKNPLSLGEAKLESEGVSFNITPSPGATTCVYNGLVDTERIAKKIGITFDQDRVEDTFGKTVR